MIIQIHSISQQSISLLLQVLWWGTSVLVIRTIALAAAGRDRTKKVTWWTALLAIAVYLIPGIAGMSLHLSPLINLLLFGSTFVIDGIIMLLHHEWSVTGWQSYGTTPIVAATFAGYAIAVTIATPMHIYELLISCLLLFGEFLSVFIDLYYSEEFIDVVCRTQWHANLRPWQGDVPYWPRVSLHVPANNEPPELVIRTLTAILQLDYPTFEVILIDDNTHDDAKWQPVMDFCLHNSIKIFHLDQFSGYKAGAINFALQQTDPQAEIIAIVDSDYIVQPHWLRETVPYFIHNPQLAFLQTPQAFTYDHQDWYHHANALAENYFFAVGMRSRAERNSIIFCGTLGLIRRRVLERIGGWAEWCVTEDAEASLRTLMRGYTGAYIYEVYGHGELPQTLADLKKQHHRWAYGSIQLTKEYLKPLLFGRPVTNRNPRYQAATSSQVTLTSQQRYDYFMHGLHWFHPLLQISLGVLLNAIILLHILHVPIVIRPLATMALIIPIIGTVIGLMRITWSARIAMSVTWREAWMTLLGLFAVNWAVARASLAGLYRKRLPFIRTPKEAATLSVIGALRMVIPESLLSLIAFGTIVALFWQGISLLSLLLACLLIWHIIVLLPAPIMALMNAKSINQRNKGQAPHDTIETQVRNAAPQHITLRA